MLYKEFTNIENTIGSDIDKINGNTGFSFINFSSILTPPLICEHKKTCIYLFVIKQIGFFCNCFKKLPAYNFITKFLFNNYITNVIFKIMPTKKKGSAQE